MDRVKGAPIQLFPNPRFLLFVLQNTVGYKKKNVVQGL